MATHIDRNTTDSGTRGLLFVLVALVALVLGFYLYNNHAKERHGVNMQVGDKEISATVTDK
jgi:hypothetical protein